MTTFKPGDKVRYKKVYGFSEWEGVEAEVTKPSNPHNVAVKFTKMTPELEKLGYYRVGETGSLILENLELIPEPKFKVGDRVTVKGYEPRNPGTFEGRTGKVVDTYNNSDSVRVEFNDGKLYNDGTFGIRYVVPAESEAKVEAFNVGDKVRIHNRGSSDKSWHGTEGEVEGLPDGNPWGGKNYRVKLTKATAPHIPDGYVASLSPGNLELIPEPKPFGFEDIQKGDTVKRTYKQPDGTVMTREGVVSTINPLHRAVSQSGTTLAFSSDTGDKKVTLELLNRPEPEPVKEPELWENRKAGDKIISYRTDGTLNRIFTKKDTGDWETLIMNDYNILVKGFTRSDNEVGETLGDHKAELFTV